MFIWRYLERLIGFLPNSKFRYWIVLERQIASSSPATLPLIPNFHYREGQPEDIDLVIRAIPHIKSSVFLKRLELGNRFVLGFIGDELVFYRWYCINLQENILELHNIVDIRVNFKLPPSAAYLWDAHTKEDFRGQGIQPHATYELCNSLLNSGITHICTMVNVNNKSSLRAFEKNLFYPVKKLLHFRLLGHDLVLSEWTLGG